MPLEDNYLDAMRGFEGFTPQAKWDAKQYSNGYGTKAQSPNEVIDETTARQRFADETGKASGYVAQAFPDLDPGKHAALASLTYNAGPGWINNSGLADAVRRGDWNDAAARFTQYNKSEGKYNEGLASRRNQEVAWFNQLPGQPISAQPQQTTVAPGALSQAPTQGPQPMADQQPALSAQSFAGPGALFGGMWDQLKAGGPGALIGAPHGVFPGADGAPGSGYDLKNAMQGAAGWMQSLDTGGKSLDMVKPRDDFSVINGPDGSIYRVNKKSGAVTPVTGPTAKSVQIGTDMGGNPIHGFIHGNNILDGSGNIVGQLPGGGAPQGAPTLPRPAGTGGAGSPGGFAQDPYLAKGVRGVDDSITDPQKYLAQFSPELGSYVKAVQEGREPTRNARKGFAEVADKIAARYGDLTGVPMDQATFTARKTMRNDLAKAASTSGLGMQRSAVNTMFDQADKLAKNYDEMSVANQFPPLNRAVNHIGHDVLGLRPSIDGFNQTLNALAEEATRLARGNAGAEADIQRLIKNMNYNASPKQFYAALDSLVSTVKRRAGESDASIRETLGERGSKEFPMIRPEGASALQSYQKRYDAINGAPSISKPPLGSFAPQPAQTQRPPLASFMN